MKQSPELKEGHLNMVEIATLCSINWMIDKKSVTAETTCLPVIEITHKTSNPHTYQIPFYPKADNINHRI